MFQEVFEKQNWEEISECVLSKNETDIRRALKNAGHGTPDDFLALISPAAELHLEEMAQVSHQLTKKRFGNTIQLYIPLYLSSECQNICTYCGFSFHNKIPRITLSEGEILNEVAVIKAMGFDHILLVTGEANKTVGVEYFKNVLRLLRPHFAHISLEVQPMDQRDYEELIPFGLNTVLVYQETYNRENYKNYHLKGKKSNFDYRLETPDRLGKAGIHKMGLGVLLGLENWRTDNFFTALHLNYLEKNYWQTRYSISFPRLRPAEGFELPKHPMSDKEFVQLICAWRIFNENIELSLSTRESAAFRNQLIKLGITHMSAGSKTNPGGYASFPESLEQFEISDERSPAEVSYMIKENGYEVVWKDWDEAWLI